MSSKQTEAYQDALSRARDLAVRMRHSELDTEHLLLALLEQEGSLISRLLKGMSVSADEIAVATRGELDRWPRVRGPGLKAGALYVTRRLSKFLESAASEANRLGAMEVSVEHLFVPLVEERLATPAGRILARFRLHRDALLRALEEDRRQNKNTAEGTEVA